MSKITHYFDLNVPKTEHVITSISPEITVTAKGNPYEANVYMASEYGAYNRVSYFYKGRDKILVPLDVIKKANAGTALAVGALPVDKLSPFPADPDNDSIYYAGGVTGGVLSYCYNKSGDAYDHIDLITINGGEVNAASIEII